MEPFDKLGPKAPKEQRTIGGQVVNVSTPWRPPQAPTPLHESDLNRLRKTIRRLLFAERDMRLTWAAAEHILKLHEEPEPDDGRVRVPDRSDLLRVLETGLVVCYARPFKPQGIGPLTEEDGWWPPTGTPGRQLHDWLLELRDRLHAHSDVTPWRESVPASVYLLDAKPGRHIEAWSPIHSEELLRIANLCRMQDDSFRWHQGQYEAALGLYESFHGH